MVVAFIGCGKSKVSYETTADKLYTSTLFKFSLQYAKENADYVFILSAKHGLVALNTMLVPYDESLNNKTDAEIKQWSKKVIKKLNEFNFDNAEYLYICGSAYKKYLAKWLPGSDPLKGLGLGKRLQWLKQHIKSSQKKIGLFD